MNLRLVTLLALLSAAAGAQAIAPGNSTGGGGSSAAAAIACAGTPGSTTGSFRQQCLDSNNTVWICKNSAGCTVAADWAQVTGLPAGGYTSVSFVAGGMTFAPTSAAVQGFTYTLTANMTGPSTFLTSLSTGQFIYFKVCQDATGGRTNTYPAIVVSAGPMDTRPSTCTRQLFWYDGANLQPVSPAVSDNGTPGFAGTLSGALGSYFGCTHGTNATCGVATLASGTVTVSTTAIGALAAAGSGGYVVDLILQSCSACGSLSVGTVTAGTSFVVNSTSGTDASKVYWEIRYVN